MFEPGDELVAINIPPKTYLADQITEGQHYTCREYLPAGAPCTECSDPLEIDIVRLEGFPDVHWVDVFIWKAHTPGFPAINFRKVEKRSDLIERLMSAPVGGDPDAEKDQPAKRERVTAPARKREKVDG